MAFGIRRIGMKGLRLHLWPTLSSLCAAGLPLLGQGCAGWSPLPEAPAVVRAASPDRPSELPPPQAEAPAAPAPCAPDQPPLEPAGPLPISLDTVFRLAQGQNARVGIARERVNEALAEKDVAARKWLPDLWVGTSYYRHEGAIQNEDGSVIHSSFGSLFGGVELNGQFDVREIAYTRVNAARKLWQRRGEYSQLNSETLLDATATYLDLLAACQGEPVIRDTEKDIQDLLKAAVKLAGVEPGTSVEVPRIKAEIAGREQMILALRGQAGAARAKLAYLLGLKPDCDLIPVDHRLADLKLVDAMRPVCDLVQQALTTGPGVREMESLLAVVHESIDRSNGLSQYAPVVGVRMAEGLFGGGPGASSDWDNRWDMVLQVRWNLTEWATVCERRRLARARLNQLHLNYDDLRGRLTAGVKEARETVLSTLAELQQNETQIRQFREAIRLSIRRYKDYPPGNEGAHATASEALQSIHGLMRSQLNYLQTLRDYDKAQLRLLVLLGEPTPADGPPCGGH
jgi:outer membrane protein TolC